MEKLMEKFRGGVIAIAIASIAIVACVCMFSTSANAESNDDPVPYPPADAIVTQEVIAYDKATFNAPFTFSFTPVTVGAPELSTQTINVSASNGVVEDPVTKSTNPIDDSNRMFTYANTFDFKFLKTSTTESGKDIFTHAGEYVYTMVYAPGTPTPTETWTPDTKGNYTVRVYVKNDGDALAITGLTFQIGEGEKELPKYSAKLVTKSDLTVKKIVTGDHGDKTQPFSFAVTLTDYEATDGTTVTGVRSGDNQKFQFSFTNHIATYSGATPLTLMHNQTLTFSSTVTDSTPLTTGTTYKIVETGVGEYKTTASCVSYNEAGATTSPGKIEYNYSTPSEAGAGITIQYAADVNNAAIVGQAPGNETDVTNNLTLTPTGFLIDAAPYILMIGIPILALIIWIVVRKRRASRQF